MKNGKPLFLFTGDEFLRRQKITALLDQLLPEPLRASNLFRIYPDELDLAELTAQAKTPSLLGGVQVFWISQAERIKKDEWSVLEPFLDAVSRDKNPAVYLIFEAEHLAKTHALIKLAGRFGSYTHLERGKEERGADLWRDKLKRAGKTLTPNAWRVLEERLGGSNRLTDLCLDQLILYSSGPVIDEEAVHKLSTECLTYEPFDIAEALAQKDIAKALIIFRFFYDLEGDMTSVVGLLHWQLKRIWQAKRILQRGGTGDDVARILRISPFRLASFLNQVKKFDFSVVEKFLDELWRLDWNTKTGATDEVTAMEAFLASIGTP